MFIDYPDFNLKLQKGLRKSGYKGKIIHYICPSVWAWRKTRIKTMNQTLDSLLCIYPFEKQFLKNKMNNIAEYVGHPLIDKIQKYAKNLTVEKKKQLIGIFPGSRKKEIEKNLPIQLKTIKKILTTHPEYSFIVSISDEKYTTFIREISAPLSKQFPGRIICLPSNKNYELMSNISFAIAASGTITLELAYHKIPTIVTYAINPVDFFIAKNILRINLPFYCIVNIIAQKYVFPELYGPNFTEENLDYYLSKFLTEKSFSEQIIIDCEKIKNTFNLSKKEPALSILETLKNKPSN